MDIDAVACVQRALTGSEFLQDLARGYDTTGARPLTAAEVRRLEQHGNLCTDWSRVRVFPGTDPDRIHGTVFAGDVWIGPTGAGGGIHQAELTDVRLEGEVCIRRATVTNYIVRAGASVTDCPAVIFRAGAVCGNGVEIPLGIETGGREVRMYAEMTVAVADRIASRRGDRAHLQAYSAAVDAYVARAAAPHGIISTGARVHHTAVADAYIGAHARIDNACLLRNTTVLSNADEPTEVAHGAYVSDSILQWGSVVTSMAIVESSVLMEHAHADRHGKITQSVVGPNTGVAEGEVTASLIGPFVGFHHQSLLIAALWPEGKGNVAHGANVGSNHPSRAPDQEIRPGEGLFIGLDTHVKFPCDFTHAPYTILAAGVLVLAQRMEFPFALINIPAVAVTGISPAYMEIRPAWVLSDNIYMIRRNEGKYQKRNKARRSTFAFEVFRPEIIDLMLAARERLAAAGGHAVYTADDIPGLGKNFMFEEHRVKGIGTYTFYIRNYALRGLLRELERGRPPGGILTVAADDPRWEHERRQLAAEFGPAATAAGLLEALVVSERTIVDDIRRSKEKDDIRGARIILDYAEAHTPAAEDTFVRAAEEAFARLAASVARLKGACA
ncbi:MAG: DUF4954 family protein [Planctomycetota bacterium]